MRNVCNVLYSSRQTEEKPSQKENTVSKLNYGHITGQETRVREYKTTDDVGVVTIS